MRRRSKSAPDWPDWRDGAVYEPLLGADRSLFAWEWLRRDPRYARAANGLGGADNGTPGAAAPAFGLIQFEPPHRPVPDARPVWSAEATPYVLPVEPWGSNSGADAVILDRVGTLATLIRGDVCEHLLLSDGLRCVRLDGPPGTFGSARVALRYRIHGVASAQAPLLVLRRWLAVCGSGAFAATLHRSELKARRWILMLRAWDGIRAGADQRDLAQVLLQGDAAEPRWRIRHPSLRSRAQRLGRAARIMAGGGYRALLR